MQGLFHISAVVSIRNVIRAAMNQALRWGLVARNVATLADAPRIERPAVRVLSAAEGNRLLDAAQGERFEAVDSVGLALGLRRGELLGLRWEDADLDAGRLRVARSLQRIGGKLQLTETKTPKSRRTLPLPQDAVRALRAHRVRQLEERLAAGPDWRDGGFDLIFTNRTGGPIEPVNLHRAYKRLLTKAGLPSIRFHNLRHSAASLMLTQGVPIKTIQEILGHSSIAVTSGFYAHLDEQLKREAAEAMDRVFGQPQKGLI
jgi:integrase